MVIQDCPPVPESLKQIQHFLTIANDHDNRDGIVSYWCRLYAVQQGMKLDKSSPPAKKLLMSLMQWLEEYKTKFASNEAITHDIPAQAHLENYALKLFIFADSQDRAGVFNKNMVKAFYTAGMIYTLLETFGELTEEVQNNRKYAKWKAAYIHNCLKNGETPVPGPMATDEEQTENAMGFSIPPSGAHLQPGPSSNVQPNESPAAPSFPVSPMPINTFGTTTPGAAIPNAEPMSYNIPPNVGDDISAKSVSSQSGAPITPELIQKAQKHCKFAGSALTYDDVETAVMNLKKALSILTTGRED